MLGNASSFTGGNTRFSQGIQKRGLAVVYQVVDEKQEKYSSTVVEGSHAHITAGCPSQLIAKYAEILTDMSHDRYDRATGDGGGLGCSSAFGRLQGQQWKRIATR